MKKKLSNLIMYISLIAVMISCSQDQAGSIEVKSPDKKIKLSFELDEGIPMYSVNRDDKSVILPSKLGFQFENIPDMNKNFKIVSIVKDSVDETWEQPWGETRNIRNHFNEVKVFLQEKSEQKRKLNLIFRAYNDGIGFRYEIPNQPDIDSIKITDEETEFRMPADESAWWIPSAYINNSFYEDLYSNTSINDIDTCHTPITLETRNGLYLAIHEANLTDYAAMTIFREDTNLLKCHLMPWSNGIDVFAKAPMVSPWRTIQIAETPGELITSYLTLNLNDPCRIEDVSWVKPCKYVGIWWGMHKDIYTWKTGPQHGATTENVMRYIDFASENGFDGVLAEGWNVGWEVDWAKDADQVSFITPYPDFDLESIAKYGLNKNVKLIGHHETGAAVSNYESQLDSAFSLYNHYGINMVKTGYVGQKMDHKEWHDGQFGVNHYRRVLETAAKYQIMLNVHEPVKQTGLRRTWPNLMTQEGARGQEYNAPWSTDGGNPPEHTTILPFTRLLAGPLDFTPGLFDFSFKPGSAHNQTTLAKQLALYVVLYSPMQMACDLPENYSPGKAFDFIKQVPVDWDTTIVINGRIGDYITIARKDRNSEDWYIGSITDENSRSLKIDLSFLDEDIIYKSELYADGPSAAFRTNPTDFTYAENEVTVTSTLDLELAPGGGQAIILKAIR